MTPRTGGEIVADHLIAEGVPYILGVPGHGDMGIFDALKDRTAQIEAIQVRHEQSAGHIADAYHRVAGKPLATVTSIGPGSANLTMALATAYVDSQALVSITGGVQTYMQGTGVLQEIERQKDADFSSIMRPVTKRSFTPGRVDQVQRAMHRAFNAALSGRRGPVHVEMPIDLQSLSDETPAMDFGNHRATHTAVRPDPAGIDAIAAALASAKRPVILAGGCVSARAHAELREVAELLGAPVITTMMGKGVFPEDHPLCAQHTGSNGTACGNHMARTADVLLAVGTRFAEQTSSSFKDGESFSSTTRLLHIDIDPREIGKNYPTEVGVVSDARTALAELYMALTERAKSLPDHSAYQAELEEVRNRWNAQLRGRWVDGALSLSKALATLRDVLPRDGIAIASAGHPQIQGFQEFPSYEPRTWLTPGGYSTMGFTVPAAIGAQLAAPDVPVVGIAGDGDFLMSIQELALAAQLNLPVVYLVMNNIGWTSIRDFQRGLFGEDRAFFTEFRDTSGELISPDFTRIAQGFGCEAIKVESFGDLRPALERAIKTDGPVVVEAIQDRDPQNTTGINNGFWDLPKPAYLEERAAS